MKEFFNNLVAVAAGDNIFRGFVLVSVVVAGGH